MTTPRIEHSDMSEYLRRCEDADQVMLEIGARPGDTPLRSSALVAVTAIRLVLSELRRIAREPGDQT